jgi:hypothetical protein
MVLHRPVELAGLGHSTDGLPRAYLVEAQQEHAEHVLDDVVNET